MDISNLLETVVTQIPNLGVAVWMLWQQQQTIKSLLDSQGKLVDRLLNYVDNDKQIIARAQAEHSSKSIS